MELRYSRIGSFKTRLTILVFYSSLFLLYSCGTPTSVNISGAHKQDFYKISGSSYSGKLSIERVEITDLKGKPSLTVKQGAPVIPQAIIKFKGSGIFSANWNVDGRIIEQVSLNLTHGSVLTLKPRQTTKIPTYQPGTHTLSLQINSPAVRFKAPLLKYFII